MVGAHLRCAATAAANLLQMGTAPDAGAAVASAASAELQAGASAPDAVAPTCAARMAGSGDTITGCASSTTWTDMSGYCVRSCRHKDNGEMLNESHGTCRD